MRAREVHPRRRGELQHMVLAFTGKNEATLSLPLGIPSTELRRHMCSIPPATAHRGRSGRTQNSLTGALGAARGRRRRRAGPEATGAQVCHLHRQQPRAFYGALTPAGVRQRFKFQFPNEEMGSEME